MRTTIPDLTPFTRKTVPLLEGIRKDVLARIVNLSEEQALMIPDGFRNCVHWHIGHMLHVQLAHWYVRRGEALPIDLGFRKYFRDGSSPLDYDFETPSFARLLLTYHEYSFGILDKFGEFLEAPMTQPFDYMNCHFATVADDLQLLIFHEGEHSPMISRLISAMKLQ